jgi:hypothetical protein
MIVQMIQRLRKQNRSRPLSSNPYDLTGDKVITGALLALALALIAHLAIILLILLTGCEMQCSPRLALNQEAIQNPASHPAGMINEVGTKCETRF